MFIPEARNLLKRTQGDSRLGRMQVIWSGSAEVDYYAAQTAKVRSTSYVHHADSSR